MELSFRVIGGFFSVFLTGTEFEAWTVYLFNLYYIHTSVLPVYSLLSLSVFPACFTLLALNSTSQSCAE